MQAIEPALRLRLSEDHRRIRRQFPRADAICQISRPCRHNHIWSVAQQRYKVFEGLAHCKRAHAQLTQQRFRVAFHTDCCFERTHGTALLYRKKQFDRAKENPSKPRDLILMVFVDLCPNWPAFQANLGSPGKRAKPPSGRTSSGRTPRSPAAGRPGTHASPRPPACHLAKWASRSYPAQCRRWFRAVLRP